MSCACITFVLACIIVPSTALNLRHRDSSLLKVDNSSLIQADGDKPIPDPTCKRGVISPDYKVCCTDDCGSCGNHKLCDNEGKYNEKTGKLVGNCCKDRILEKKVSCDKDHPPCVLSPSYKKQLNTWKAPDPKRNAMDDCTKAKTIQRMTAACGVDKGEFMGRLWVVKESRYEDAIDLVHKVEEAIKILEKKVKESDKIPKYIKEEAGNKAKKLKGKAEDGLKDAKALREKIIEAKCVDKFQLELDKLEAHSDVVLRDAEMLWQVWQEAEKLKDLEDRIAMYQARLDKAEQKEKHIQLGDTMMLEEIEKRNKLRCLAAGEQIKQLEEALKKMGKKDKVRAALIPGQIRKAKASEKEECRQINIMKTNYKGVKEAFDEELKTLKEDIAELKKAKEEEMKLKQAAYEFIKNEIDKYTTTTTTTTVPSIVHALGNNGAAYCSAYCAYNWNDQIPKAYGWKGACCLAAYNANNNQPISCMAKNFVGAGTHCTCQRSDSLPFLQGAGAPASYTNMQKGTVCADAKGVAAEKPTTTTTTTTTTTNLKCNCYHCGNNNAFNNADVCGPASGVCGPDSADNSGCWTNRDQGCVCSTHTLIQPCQCFHCGGSDPFPQADICGAASNVCSPSSPQNNGCWTNVNANCQCGSQQTTG